MALGELALALNEATELAQAYTAFARAVEALGFTGSVYTSLPPELPATSGAAPVFLRSEGFSESFLRHYSEAGFARSDFTIRRIRAGDLAVMDWWGEQRKGLLSADEQQVIQVARSDYRIVNGLSIPAASSPYSIAGASISSEEQDRAFEKLVKERLPSVQTAVRIFHNHLIANPRHQARFYQELLDRLSARERELLRLAASGARLKQHASSGIGAIGAGKGRSRLFEKFGVRNVAELSHLVGILQLLDML